MLPKILGIHDGLAETDLKGFDSAHRAVVRNGTISPAARLLFVILNSFDGARHGCVVSNARLALYMGCSKRSIQFYLKELRDQKLIFYRDSDTPTHRKVEVLVRNPKTPKIPMKSASSPREASFATPVNNASPPHEASFTQDIEIGIDKELERELEPSPSTAPKGCSGPSGHTGSLSSFAAKQGTQAATATQDNDSQFNRFWQAYPKKYSERPEDVSAIFQQAAREEGFDFDAMIGAIERKKRRRAIKLPKSDFEPEFSKPSNFLKRREWLHAPENPPTPRQELTPREIYELNKREFPL